MNSILLANEHRSPIAMLLMSGPKAPRRSCILTFLPTGTTGEPDRGRWTFMPGRPTQYACGFLEQAHDGFEVMLKGRDDWNLGVMIGIGQRGRWWAEKSGALMQGFARAV